MECESLNKHNRAIWFLLIGVVFYTLVDGVFVALFYPIPLDNSRAQDLIFVLVVGALIVAPIFEELIFRGPVIYFAKTNRSRFFLVISIVFSIGVFTYLHASAWMSVVQTAVLVTYIAIIFRNLWLCMLIHFLINLTLVVAGLIFDQVFPSLSNIEIYKAIYPSYPVYSSLSVIMTGGAFWLIHSNRKQLLASYEIVFSDIRYALIKRGWLNKSPTNQNGSPSA